MNIDFNKPKRRKRNPETISASQAAKLMSLHPNTILWNIRQGYLKARYDGYRYLIRLSDLKQFREDYYNCMISVRLLP